MSTRRQSREMALQILFQWEFLPNLKVDQSLNLFKSNFEASEDTWNYAKELVEGIRQNEQKIDDILSSSSSHWSVHRMPLVDRNIMRIAIFELLMAQEPIPLKAAINEAIEIAKKYGTTDSPAFINGVLDQIVKTQKPKA
jgi:N utilization substance protein B